MRNLRVNKRCWLIVEPGGRAPTLAVQFAQLRGLEVQHCDGAEGPLASARPGSDPLIATSFAAFNRMTSRERESLRASVNGGATLYIRGGDGGGVRYQLA